MEKLPKLYLVTRSDLPPGAQAAQLVHAMAEFASDRPETFAAWKADSNTVVCLAARNEEELHKLRDRLDAACVEYVAFTEPDLDGALTSIALEPDGASFVKRLPLALAS